MRNDVTVSWRDYLEVPNRERHWLEITIPKSHGFLVGTFYRPPNSFDYHDKDFMTRLDGIMDNTTAQGNEVLVLGDFNCNFLFSISLCTAPECKQLKTLFNSLQLKQLIKEPTSISQDSCKLIDLIATNGPQNFSSSGEISANLSDNEIIYGVRKLNWKKVPAQIKTLRNWANYVQGKFCEELRALICFLQ